MVVITGGLLPLITVSVKSWLSVPPLPSPTVTLTSNVPTLVGVPERIPDVLFMESQLALVSRIQVSVSFVGSISAAS